MATIETAGTIQAGVTAPALIDTQGTQKSQEPRDPRTELAANGSTDPAVVEISQEAQKVVATPTAEQQADDAGNGADARKDSITEKIREQVSSIQSIGRKTAFDAENGQVQVRQGDEVVREIPSDEVLRIRENIESFKQAQEGLDISV